MLALLLILMLTTEAFILFFGFKAIGVAIFLLFFAKVALTLRIKSENIAKAKEVKGGTN